MAMGCGLRAREGRAAWRRRYRGSEASYTPTEKEILAAYEGVRAASEVIGTEAQLLLAPWLPVLGWMFKGRVSSTHHATDATWSKWAALITQRARIGNPSHPGILEIIMDWPEGKDFGMSPEEIILPRLRFERLRTARVLNWFRSTELVVNNEEDSA